MRDERSRRRPEFRPGIEVRLADGQVWSLPLPPPGPPVDPGGAAGDDRGYRAIVRAALEAGGEGERFRAGMALAIHLLGRNYALDADDFGDLLDDRGEGRRRADLAHAFRALALAHLGPSAPPAGGAPGRAPGPGRDDVRRAIGREPARVPGRRAPRGAGGPVDRAARSASEARAGDGER